MKNIIEEFEKTQINKNIPLINTGYYIEIKIWILEGKKKRIQKFDGIIISIKNRGLNSSFTVRKIINNEGVERVFQTHSPIIKEIKIVNYNNSKKSKLYYLRNIKNKNLNIF
ncbi:MAG: 50S ribosomal protein L19 [Enterobacteriaceae bacterium PSpicST2]|nr:MAG: 50S ribosomal protein L19 [Enterobacteriaceae bacterium PSpicST2]WMC19154.1 MAG: 50S ribosomal protein L19 [Enterobacteriaceae bacterium PSpicST1]